HDAEEAPHEGAAEGAEGNEDEAEAPRAAVLGRRDRVAPGAEEGEEEVTTTRTQPAASDPWTPIFSTGNHLGIEWTRAALAALVRNFEIFQGKIIPPIGVGHNEPDVLPGYNKSAQP